MQEPLSKQEAKSQLTRDKICRAVVRCLVQRGYSETSINRVVAEAGVSKGALQHHYPNKEELMAATASWLLANARYLSTKNVRGPSSSRSTARELMKTWRKGANTDEFRALLEILVTMRTDRALKARLGPELRAWHDQSMALISSGYETAAADDEVELLLTLNSCVIRGLVIQQQYTDDPRYLNRLMNRWIELVAPMLLPREPD